MAAHLLVLAFVVAASGIPVRNDSPYMMKHSIFEDILVNYNEKMHAVVSNKKKLWPNGQVFYDVDPSAELMMPVVKKAFREIEEHTCVKFTPSPLDEDTVFSITAGSPQHKYCTSTWGRASAGSEMHLQEECLSLGGVLYHIVRVLGFVDEQTRPDRDNYIVVHNENIETGYEGAFTKMPNYLVRILTPYDYDSVSHVGESMYAASPGLKTITANDNRKLKNASEKTGLSPIDIEKINKAYECKT